MAIRRVSACVEIYGPLRFGLDLFRASAVGPGIGCTGTAAGKRKRSPFNGPDIPRPANVACGPADRRNRLSNSVDDARPKPGSANGLRGDRTFGLQFRMGGLEL